MQASSDLLQVRALSFAYGKRRLWENVNFDVPVGAVTGILGNNGTGKSTLLNCIGGILQPDAGNVFFKGVDLLNFPAASALAMWRTSHSTLKRPVQASMTRSFSVVCRTFMPVPREKTTRRSNVFCTSSALSNG